MEEIKLPRHVIDGVERRWASKLEQAAHAWKSKQRTQEASSRQITRDGQRIVPVVTRRSRKR